ncbi:acyl-CoA reductase-like NAD-dependent aldehyde dehydrogenase [Azospirillum doebereinerae]|uniref:Aldehyde dehydrogenase family protein n=1 Tax=Azospirillum doebereinerae TaxID=92933 RepID=A0A3S1CHD3_9PROT|nr:aldehyde dehydrogenase family protein [Azospirillum doebereinerae]
MAAAQPHGATAVTGGARIDRPGFLFQPTVLTGAPACRATSEEPFGPLAPVAPFRDFDDTVA